MFLTVNVLSFLHAVKKQIRSYKFTVVSEKYILSLFIRLNS